MNLLGKRLTFPLLCLVVGLAVFGTAYHMLGQGPGSGPGESNTQGPGGNVDDPPTTGAPGGGGQPPTAPTPGGPDNGEVGPVANVNELFRAVAGGTAEEVKQQLMNGHSATSTDAQGNTPLHFLLVSPLMSLTPYGVTNVLLEYGAQPNLANNSGQTPLHFAAQNGASEAVVIALIKAGGDPLIETFQVGGTAMTPYEIALREGNVAAIAAIEKSTDYRPPNYESLKAEGLLWRAYDRALERATTNEQRTDALRTLCNGLVQIGVHSQAQADALFEQHSQELQYDAN